MEGGEGAGTGKQSCAATYSLPIAASTGAVATAAAAAAAEPKHLLDLHQVSSEVTKPPLTTTLSPRPDSPLPKPTTHHEYSLTASVLYLSTAKEIITASSPCQPPDYHPSRDEAPHSSVPLAAQPDWDPFSICHRPPTLVAPATAIAADRPTTDRPT